MRWTAALALLLLVMPAGALPWAQDGGDAGRSGAVDIGPEPLDVVVPLDLTGPKQQVSDVFGSFPVTPHGLMGIRLTQTITAEATGAVTPAFDGCEIIRLSPVTFEIEVVTGGLECPAGAKVLAYEPVDDLFVVAFDGAAGPPTDGTLDSVLAYVDEIESQAEDARAPTVVAFSAETGQEAWTYVPDMEGLPGAYNAGDWGAGGVYDESSRVLYVIAASDAGQNQLSALQLPSLQVLWRTSLPKDLNEAEGAAHLTGDGFLPHHLALTDTGIVLVGQAGVDTLNSMATFYVSLDGTVQGFNIATVDGGTQYPQTSQLDPRPLVSARAVAQRSQAAFLMDESVFTVDPSVGDARPVAGLTRTPTPFAPDPEAPPAFGYPAFAAPPAWTRDYLLVPDPTSIFVLDARPSAVLGQWIAPTSGTVTSVVATDGGDAFAATLQEGDPGTALVHRFDPGTRHTMQTLRIPGDLVNTDVRKLHLTGIPGGGGLFVWTEEGVAAILAHVDEEYRPVIGADDPYARLDKPLELSVDWRGPEPASMTISWGDGIIEEDLDPGAAASRMYPEAGDFTIYVTGVEEDGTTRTATLLVHPGIARPEELTWTQQQFTPENQERTYFLLGLIITLIGAVIAIVARSRHRSRYSVWLYRLEDIHAQGRKDPFAALRELAGWRAGVREDLARGRLPETHHAGLEAAGRGALERLRRRVLGAMEGRLSRKFERRLDAALSDGIVEASEAKDLTVTIAHEIGLTKAERLRLSELIGSWPTA